MPLFALILWACGADEAVDTSVEPVAVEWPAYSGQACPSLIAGSQSFESAGLTREVQLILPADPVGKPLVFVWHYLGGSPEEMVRYMGLEAFALAEEVIIVAPKSRGLQFEWDFIDSSDANPDLVLFDDLLSCVGEAFTVDSNRVYATGMSAGGLFTTFLTHHRSEWFAATAPFSGGSTSQLYERSVDPIPVLVTWGGPNDSYGGFDFSESSADLSRWLREDGHFVVECEHDLGHTIPPGAIDFAWQFFKDYPKAQPVSPYSTLPPVFPDWCRIPEAL